MPFTVRQNLLARALLAVASKAGTWPKSHDADGACYLDEAANVSKAAGFQCRNCAFWKTPNGCAIVKGPVQAGGICRFHVIPPERLKQAQTGAALKGRIQGETI